MDFVLEDFTEEERAILAPHFTNLDGPVFALVDLPEVVKGALFARYSRSPKSLRRLFLDEFASGAAEDLALTAVYATTVTPRVGAVVSFYSTMARRVCLIMLGLGLAWYEVMCAWVTRQLDKPPDLWLSLVLLFGVPILVAPWYVRWLKTKVPDS